MDGLDAGHAPREGGVVGARPGVAALDHRGVALHPMGKRSPRDPAPCSVSWPRRAGWPSSLPCVLGRHLPPGFALAR
eukprot:5876807-Alexandrium_andersonii.AAC.1